MNQWDVTSKTTIYIDDKFLLVSTMTVWFMVDISSSVTVAGKDSSNHDAADSTAQNGNKKIGRFATGKCTKENVLCCWKGYVEETSYWAIKHLHMNIISYTYIYIYIYVYIDIDTDIYIYIYVVHFNIISCTFRAHCTTIPLRNCIRTILIWTYDNSIASSPVRKFHRAQVKAIGLLCIVHIWLERIAKRQNGDIDCMMLWS